MTIKTLVTGFPRIGEKRELKKELESFWAGRSSVGDLQRVSDELRKKQWRDQMDAGIDLISCNDFSWYDSMLDTAVMLNAVPERFRQIADTTERYFSMARGNASNVAMEMTKWFNTNYHYLVPELDDGAIFSLNPEKIMNEYAEAKSIGVTPKINVIGPLTFLGLSKRKDGGDCYDYFDRVLPVYLRLMEELSRLDETVYVQMDEPVFVRDPSDRQLTLLGRAYRDLAAVRDNVRILVTTYFEHSNEATAVLADTPVWGIGLDFVHGPKNLDGIGGLKGKKLAAGVIDGRNIWINDLSKSLDLLERLSRAVPKDDIIISTSCSMLHVPYTAANERTGDPAVRQFSFAKEKLNEIALLSRLFHNGTLTDEDRKIINDNSSLIRERRGKKPGIGPKSIAKRERPESYEERNPAQKKNLNLPPLATTTIGSFPQTPEIRKLRSDFKNGSITPGQYEAGIRRYIDDCIAFQEEIGLDVLVHGEAERNDMVEYFGEMLDGFHFTNNGWVQSYGSRCVKPPVINSDVHRPSPMTVRWITYAQTRTGKPVKGMLTGPVTILQWSFVRDDIPRSDVSEQIAAALREEIADLQAAGIKIIQVDEPAFKEGYPLRKENVSAYEKWAVRNFKLAVSSAGRETQIHSHMCYSEFNDIIKTIEAMDADVITIETARSGNELLGAFRDAQYSHEIGPGIYDIHSPRVPAVEEFMKEIRARLEVLPLKQLWINPDCGLKTRTWAEVKPALKNMVDAVRRIRADPDAG